MSENKFMRMAIELSKESVARGGGPFGAVIVRDGEVVATGSNSVTLLNDPTAQKQALFERAFQKAAGGGCHAPIGAVAVPVEQGWDFLAALGDESGNVYKTCWHLALDAEPTEVEDLTAKWKGELGLA